MTVSVIIPTLNEERVLAATLERARQPGVHEIIVVDGGSTRRDRARRGASTPISSSRRRAAAPRR